MEKVLLKTDSIKAYSISLIIFAVVLIAIGVLIVHTAFAGLYVQAIPILISLLFFIAAMAIIWLAFSYHNSLLWLYPDRISARTFFGSALKNISPSQVTRWEEIINPANNTTYFFFYLQQQKWRVNITDKQQLEEVKNIFISWNIAGASVIETPEIQEIGKQENVVFAAKVILPLAILIALLGAGGVIGSIHNTITPPKPVDSMELTRMSAIITAPPEITGSKTRHIEFHVKEATQLPLLMDFYNTSYDVGKVTSLHPGDTIQLFLQTEDYG